MKLQLKKSDYLNVFTFYFIGYLLVAKFFLVKSELELYAVVGVLVIGVGFFLKIWQVFKTKVCQVSSWKVNAQERIKKELYWAIRNGLIFSMLCIITFVFVTASTYPSLKTLVIFCFCCVLWSLTVNFTGEFLHLLASVKGTQKRIEQEKNEVIKLKKEVLQDLVSPHFLFNSLNTISSYISENKAKSIRIVKELSDLYGFILNNVHKSVVFVSEDLELAKKYSFLLKSRLESGFEITFDVPGQYLGCYIPPMTLQNLVENCIKHNVVTKRSILTINIYIEDDYIVVKNNLNLKMNSGMGSTNLGLNYIQSQIEQLSEKTLIITKTEREFTVKIPLIYEVNLPENESVNH